MTDWDCTCMTVLCSTMSGSRTLFQGLKSVINLYILLVFMAKRRLTEICTSMSENNSMFQSLTKQIFFIGKKSILKQCYTKLVHESLIALFHNDVLKTLGNQPECILLLADLKAEVSDTGILQQGGSVQTVLVILKVIKLIKGNVLITNV